MSITTEVKLHADLEAICFQESCEDEYELIILEYNDDILYVEYESFSYGV